MSTTRTNQYDSDEPNISHVEQVDFAGDIFVSLGNNLGFIRLPIGEDGDVLTVDSGEASGLKWVAP